MNVEPCNVCGGTDVNLVDGFYYCAECGTQDMNVRETVVEDKALADGTFTIRRHNKVTIVAEETQELSGEWHKWHAYNFVLCGLADELIAVGAKPTFKMKLLWLWTKYIKQFQNKDELGLTKDGEEETANQNTETSEVPDGNSSNTSKMKYNYRAFKMTTDLSVVKKGTLCSLIVAALNLDRSEIQISDLTRYIREGRLDFDNCLKYVPKEIKFRLVPQCDAFIKSTSTANLHVTVLAVFKCLDVVPILPDLRLLVDRFTKELCLPNDFKNLVFSLMDLVPCDNFLDIDRSTMNSLLRMPNYECTIMVYILVALKLCFGLDDHYEEKLSDVVDKVNDENCHLKSYKLGGIPEPTDRLFSFREWCSFLQLRKIILCKYYLHMAEQYELDIDDYVYMEQCKPRVKVREPTLSDEITMNILDKIPQVNTAEVIPKSEFKPTLTPLSTYTDLVLLYLRDPDLRLLFSEDFTQYSLKYACEKLYLCTESETSNVITGVDKGNKVINKHIIGRLAETKHDAKMVYVRNCENKNWLKTNQPSVEHIEKVKISNSDRESDHGYDSNAEKTSEIEISSKDEESSNQDSVIKVDQDEMEAERKLEIIEEEDPDKNIFDDDFENLVFVEEDVILNADEIKNEEPDIQEDNLNNNGENIDVFQNDPFPNNEDNDSVNDSGLVYDPDTFDREKIIKELVLATCDKYKIRIPTEYRTDETNKPKKRKPKLVNDVAGESSVKRRKVEDGSRKRETVKRGEAMEEVHKLLAGYYENLQHDVMLQISEHVKGVVNDVSQAQEAERDINETNNTETAPEDVDRIVVSNLNDENIGNTGGDDQTANVTENLEQSSLQLLENDDNIGDNSDDENSQPKEDPKFNEKEYDIKQLYVKVDDGEESDSDDLFGMTKDPELMAIVDKKIEEAAKGELPPPVDEVPSDKDNKTHDSDDDDLPLSFFKDTITAMEQKRLRHEYLPKLIMKQENIKEFRYWTRFYANTKMVKMREIIEPFNLELQENYPVSFVFLIKECAGIVDCSPFCVYKAMVSLEQRLLSHNR